MFTAAKGITLANIFLRFRLAYPVTGRALANGRWLTDMFPKEEVFIRKLWLRVKKELLADREYGSWNAVGHLAGTHTAEELLRNNWVRTRSVPNGPNGPLDGFLGRKRPRDDDDLEIIHQVPEASTSGNVRMRRVRFADGV